MKRRSRHRVLALLALGILAGGGACTKHGDKTSTASGTPSGTAADPWADLCAKAAAHAVTCKADFSRAACDAKRDCAGQVLDPAALPKLAKCFEGSACGACDYRALTKDVTSAAAKTAADALATRKADCPDLDYASYEATAPFGILAPGLVLPLAECAKPKDCNDAAGCAMGLAATTNMKLFECRQALSLVTAEERQFAAAMAAAGDGGTISVGGSVALDPGAAGGAEPANPLLDKPAPEISVKGVGKKPAPTLRALRGKIVILHFFASWCAPCEKSFPSFKAVADRNPGVVVLGVSSDDSASDVEPFLKKMKSTFTVGWDDGHKTSKAYGQSTMPATYLIDQKGVVRYVELGYREASDKPLEAAIKKLK